MYSRYGARSKAARFGRWASKPLGQLTIFASVVLLIGVASGLMMGAWTGAIGVVDGVKVANDIVDGNPGTIIGPGEIVASQYGPSFSFDGKSSQIVVADDPKLRLPEAMTVAAWINPEGTLTDAARLVGKGSSELRNYGLWRTAAGHLLFQVFGRPQNCPNAMNPNIPATLAPNGVWTHVAGTYDGAFIRLFVNGRLEIETPCDINPHVSADPLTFGYAGYHTYYAGLIDQIEIHNSSMDASQIAALMGADLTKRAEETAAESAKKAAAAGWVEATLQGDWVNTGNGFSTAGYKRDADGVVHLKGFVRGSTDYIMTLSEGYRPGAGGVFTSANNTPGESSRILIVADGTVRLLSPFPVEWVSLEGISFPAQ